MAEPDPARALILEALETRAERYFDEPWLQELVKPWVKTASTYGTPLGREIVPNAPWMADPNNPPRFAHSEVGYALFHNPETQEYLVTCRDSRRPIYMQDFHNRKAVIDWTTFDDAGLSGEQAAAHAKEIWSHHLRYLTEFFPVIDRNDVDYIRATRRDTLGMERTGRHVDHNCASKGVRTQYQLLKPTF